MLDRGKGTRALETLQRMREEQVVPVSSSHSKILQWLSIDSPVNSHWHGSYYSHFYYTQFYIYFIYTPIPHLKLTLYIHLHGLPKRATCNCPSLLPSRLHLLYPPPVTSLFQYSVYIKKILRPIPNDASSKKCLLILPMCLPHPAANCHYFSIETQGSWYLLFSI